MMLRIEEQVVSRLSHVQITASQDDDGELKPVAPVILPKKINSQKTFLSRVDSTFIKSEAKPVIELPTANVKKKVVPAHRNPLDKDSWGEIGRNESCPCNSGKKYKNCHGS